MMLSAATAIHIVGSLAFLGLGMIAIIIATSHRFRTVRAHIFIATGIFLVVMTNVRLLTEPFGVIDDSAGRDVTGMVALAFLVGVGQLVVMALMEEEVATLADKVYNHSAAEVIMKPLAEEERA